MPRIHLQSTLLNAATYQEQTAILELEFRSGVQLPLQRCSHSGLSGISAVGIQRSILQPAHPESLPVYKNRSRTRRDKSRFRPSLMANIRTMDTKRNELRDVPEMRLYKATKMFRGLCSGTTLTKRVNPVAKSTWH